MRETLTYTISELADYINWAYFYHAWGLTGKPEEERVRLRTEAESMLREAEGKYCVKAVFGLYDACSDGDDLLLGGVRIPMLRQQRPSAPGQPCLCLTDFVRPQSMGTPDTVGAFATSVASAMVTDHRGDVYVEMMAQTLADRLAEAAAEKLHQAVRRHYWGYAPDENLTMEQLHAEQFQGIRPAVGYPSLPDTSINFLLADLLGMDTIGIRLTASGMMTPHASVSGFMFAHPAARYFQLGRIDEDQLADYAHRRGVPVSIMRKFLQSSLLPS